jgi:DNA-binding transcriptional LysR family regulator
MAMSRNSQTQIKFSQLRALVAVANLSNFGEAALQLGVSQSAVSHAIATLETDLGVQLFLRGRHGAQLTPVGERIVSRAQQIMHLVTDIEEEANLVRGLQGGSVRIASFRSVATHILPNAIAQFRQRFPAIAISVAEYDDSPSVEEDLRKGRADIGFTHLPTSDEFETWELLQDEYVVLFPPGVELQLPLRWEQLQTYPLVMALDGCSCDQQVYAHCLKFDTSLHIAYQFKTDSTIVNMVAQGLGATIIPRLAAEPIPPGLQVFSLPVPLFRIIGMAMLANSLQTPAVFAFLDLLKDKIFRG